MNNTTNEGTGEIFSKHFIVSDLAVASFSHLLLRERGYLIGFNPERNRHNIFVPNDKRCATVNIESHEEMDMLEGDSYQIFDCRLCPPTTEIVFLGQNGEITTTRKQWWYNTTSYIGFKKTKTNRWLVTFQQYDGPDTERDQLYAFFEMVYRVYNALIWKQERSFAIPKSEWLDFTKQIYEDIEPTKIQVESESKKMLDDYNWWKASPPPEESDENLLGASSRRNSQITPQIKVNPNPTDEELLGASPRSQKRTQTTIGKDNE